MIIATINERRYKLKNDWADWTLGEAIQLSAHEYPNGIESAVDWFEHINKVREVWRLFTDANPDIIQPHWLIYTFDKYCAPLWEDLYSEVPKNYAPIGIKTFEFKGVVYKIPISLPFDGAELPGLDMTAKSFVEAGNLLSEFAKSRRDGFRRLPYLVAAVVGVDGENYDEIKILRRAEAFRDLPMPIVWEVFFSLLALLRQHLSATLIFIEGEAMTIAKEEALRSGPMSWLSRTWLEAFKKFGS